MLRGTAISQQLASAGLIATCLALQLAGTLHLMVVEHELCFEHGEAVDVAGSAHHDHGGRVPAGTDRSASEISATSGRDGHGATSHDHCPQVEDRAGRALIVARAFEGAPPPTLLAMVAAPSTPWTLSVDALRLLAPKTSPPV